MNTEPKITPEPKVEAYTFSKDKLPRELSYPLKRSLLDDALRVASVYEIVWFVRYVGRPNGNTVLDAYFEPEQTGYASAGKVMITVWAVPASLRVREPRAPSRPAIAVSMDRKVAVRRKCLARFWSQLDVRMYW